MPEITVGLTKHWHRPDRKKVCAMCGERKPLAEFSAYGYTTNQGKRSTRYESRCKECSRQRRKKWWRENPDKARFQNERRDPKKMAEIRDRYQKTAHGKAIKAKNQRLRKARIRAGLEGRSERDPRIRAIYAKAIEIERVIACCPVFDLPELTKKIHVDHIIPLKSGGLHVADNLQMLPAGLNMRKGAKCLK